MPIATQNPIDYLPASQVVRLIQFDTAAQTYRYAIWQVDVTVSSATYTAKSDIEVEVGKSHGGLEESPSFVTMSRLAPFNVTMFRALPSVVVTISEMRVGDSASLRTIAKGLVRRVTINYQNKPGVVRIEVASPKSEYSGVVLGLQVNEQCSWGFGDSNCLVDVVANSITGTLTIVSGSTVLVQAAGMPTSPARFYRGYVTLAGLSIDIRDDLGHESGGFRRIILDLPPPKSWNNVSVVLSPGCDKLAGTCLTRWNNILRNASLGIKTPSKEPNFEVG